MQEKIVNNIGYFYTVAFRYVSNKFDADDLVQTAVLNCLNKPEDLERMSDTEFRKFFCFVLRNLYIDQHRKIKRRPKNVDIESYNNSTVAIDKADPFTILSGKEQIDLIVNYLIKRFGGDKTDIYLLQRIDNIKVKDIAQSFNLPMGTVCGVLAKMKADIVGRYLN